MRGGGTARNASSTAPRTHTTYDGLPGLITYLRARAVRVAVIGCAPYGWAQNLLDITGTQALVRKAVRHGQVVIVYMHAGAERADADHISGREESYLGERRGNPVAFAHAMIDAGADLVLASGPHVLRGMLWYKHRLIAYSLGNLATSHRLAKEGILADSGLLRVTLDAHGRFIAGSLIPLKLNPTGTPTREHLVTAARTRRRGLSMREGLLDRAEQKGNRSLDAPASRHAMQSRKIHSSSDARAHERDLARRDTTVLLNSDVRLAWG